MFYVESDTPLKIEKITKILQEMRSKADVDFSHFAVSAVVEVIIDEKYFYVSGVNVEDHHHNRYALHAEHNATSSAKTLLLSLFGPKIKFSKVWVMGAMEGIEIGSELANAEVMPCGHCRQVLMSNSTDDCEVFSVTVNGNVKPYKLKDLYPHPFSEKDLGKKDDETISATSTTASTNLFKAKLARDLAQDKKLTDIEITQYLKILKPYVIDEGFKTSKITTVILKLDNGVCIPGSLNQDIAFLTIDAIYAAVGMAVSRFGAKNFKIQEVHLFAPQFDGPVSQLLTGAETQCIKRFANVGILDVFIHGESDEIKKHTIDVPATITELPLIEF